MLTCFPVILWGQSRTFHSNGYYIEQFTARDGLPGTSVADIIQGPQGFLWLATHDGLARYDGYGFEVFQADTSTQGGGFKNFFYTLRQDSRGTIWVGTLNRGVFLFDPEKEKFTHHFRHHPEDENSLCSDWIYTIEEDPNGAVWIATSEGVSRIHFKADTLRHQCFQGKNSSRRPNTVFSSPSVTPFYYRKTGRLCFYGNEGIDQLTFNEGAPEFEHIPFPAGGELLAEVSTMANSRDGQIWIAGKGQKGESEENTIARWNPRKNSFQSISHAIPNDVAINHLYEDEKGNLWAGTWGRGIFILKPPFHSAADQEHLPLFSNDDRETGNIWAFCPDRFGNLWVGTWRGPLYKIHLRSNRASLTKLPIGRNEFAVPGHITEDAGGNVWATTKEGYLFRQSLATGRLTRFALPGSEAARTIEAPTPVVAVDEAIWLGSHHGLLQFFPATGKHRFFEITRTEKSLPKDWINVLVRQGDTLWCGTTHGSLYGFDLKTRAFQAWHEEYTNLGVINDILISSEGFLLASTSKGLHKIEASKPSNRSFNSSYAGGLDLVEANDGTIWLSSYLGGLHHLDIPGKAYFEQSNVQLNWITGVQPDSQGRLWLVGPNGLFRFSPTWKNIEVFTELNRFSFFNAATVTGKYRTQDGRFLFAGEEGIISFHPDSIHADTFLPNVVARRILINNQDIREDEALSSLPAPSFLRVINLPYFRNDITVEYAGLQFNQPDAIRYSYRLEGLQEGWVEAGNERIARFSNLPPGAYSFRVKAANGEGVWGEGETLLTIRIFPPWWRSWWAYLLYGISASATLWALYRFQLNRRLAAAEANRLKEMDRLKTHLYTNITHEFRTPLTVILGMTEQARGYFKVRAAEKFEPAVRAVQRNARQLLRLVNQMLDLARLEAGALEVNMIQDDVTAYLQYLSGSFRSLAESKDIQLMIHQEKRPLIMDFDPDKLFYIVSNLLSNAIKYTPEGGKVVFRISTENQNSLEWLLLEVKDNGIGVGPAELPYIFDRFYRASPFGRDNGGTGAGIGLAFTKELVKLLNGQVKAKSSPGKGSIFTVRLPIHRNAKVQKAAPFSALPETPTISDNGASHSSGERHTILIVEDNPDVQAYLQACLEGQYEIIKAGNGQEGIDKALEIVPDLIISDVMMPEKDGFELCRYLKKNERTSHIPIVLLTARADEASRLEGLEGGADAYLPKPFNQKELFVRLKKLIELRQRLQARYQQASPFSLPPEAAFSREDDFIKKVQAQMKAHLSDETFGVRELAGELAMSRSQVFKKLKALTGQSIAQYMRSYRLHCARQLLKSSTLSVSEVAYAVGFRDPAYFSRVFSDAFGAPPSEARK